MTTGMWASPLVLEEAFPELPDQLSHVALQEDVVRGEVENQGLVAVVVLGGRLPADDLVVVLARLRELAVRMAEAGGASTGFRACRTPAHECFELAARKKGRRPSALASQAFSRAASTA